MRAYRFIYHFILFYDVVYMYLYGLVIYVFVIGIIIINNAQQTIDIRTCYIIYIVYIVYIVYSNDFTGSANSYSFVQIIWAL